MAESVGTDTSDISEIKTEQNVTLDQSTQDERRTSMKQSDVSPNRRSKKKYPAPNPKPQNVENSTTEVESNKRKSSQDSGAEGCTESTARDSVTVKLRRGERESKTDFGDLDQIAEGAPPILKNRGKLCLKRRGPFAKWKSYFVVVDEKQFQMSFYKSSEEYDKLASCKTAIDLRFVEKVIPLKPGLLKTNHPFKLLRRAGLSTVKVAADTEEERATWINTVEDLLFKIRHSPGRDSSSETLKAHTLPRGISTTIETQTSDSEAIAASAPEEDVQIRPRKVSKQGIKLDANQLTSIKLKRIESGKEKEERTGADRESFDPEQKFGVSLRRISSERRTTPPKSPDNEHVTEFKIKFNSLKRSKAPVIPMSNTLRNTVGDITNQQRLNPSPTHPSRKTSEVSRKRSPSPNIPISDSVKSVMKKPSESGDTSLDNEEDINERKESKICHATTTVIPQFDVQPLVLEQDATQVTLNDVKEDSTTQSINDSKSLDEKYQKSIDVSLQIKDIRAKREEEFQEMLSFCDDGRSDLDKKKELNKSLSLPASSHKLEDGEEVLPIKSKIEEAAEIAPIAVKLSEKQTSPTEVGKETNKVHRSYSSITITTNKYTEPINLPESTIKIQETPKNIIDNNSANEAKGTPMPDKDLAEEKNIPTNHVISKENKDSSDNISNDLMERVKELQGENVKRYETSPEIKNLLEHQTSIDSLEPTTEITIADIKFIDQEDHMQTIKTEELVPSDNIHDFMAQMIDHKPQSQAGKDSTRSENKAHPSQVLPDLVSGTSTSNENNNQGAIDEYSSKCTEAEKSIEAKKEMVYTFENRNKVSSSKEEEKELQEKQSKQPIKRKNSFYKMFNSIENDEAVVKHPTDSKDIPNIEIVLKDDAKTEMGIKDAPKAETDSKEVSITTDFKDVPTKEIDIKDCSTREAELKDVQSGEQPSPTIDITIKVVESELTQNKKTSQNSIIDSPVVTRENSLSVDDQKEKRPSDISLGSSECDEPLPKFCFLGQSDRSSTGSAVLRGIISAAEEELKKLPMPEENLVEPHHSSELKISNITKTSNSASLKQNTTKTEIRVEKEEKAPEIVNQDKSLNKSSNSKISSEKRSNKKESSDPSLQNIPALPKTGSSPLLDPKNSSNSNRKAPKEEIILNQGCQNEEKLNSEETSDYFPAFTPVEFRTNESSSLTVQESSESFRSSGINGLKEYLNEEEQKDSESVRGPAISRLGHSVAIEKLRTETT